MKEEHLDLMSGQFQVAINYVGDWDTVPQEVPTRPSTWSVTSTGLDFVAADIKMSVSSGTPPMLPDTMISSDLKPSDSQRILADVWNSD